MALDWVFKLNDLVSGPTASIDRQLRSLTTSIKALDLAAKEAKLEKLTDPLKRQRLELSLQRDQLRLTKDQLQQHGGVLSSLADKITSNRQAMRDWLLILDPLARGFRYVADGARDMGRRIAEAVTTREDALIGLRSAFGDRGGRSMLNQMQAMAVRTGRPIGGLLDQATRYGNLGAPPGLIGPMVSAVSDAQARKLDAGRLDQTLTSMLSRPVLDMREIKGGLTGVMDEKKFWAQLAKNLGMSVGDANNAVAQNRVPSRAGVDALLQSFAGTQGGRLGSVTNERATQTLQGILDRFTERTSNLLGGIEKTAGFKTLKSALNNLLSVLGEQNTQKMINGLANNLGAMLKPLTGPEGRKNMRAFFTDMNSAIAAVMPGLLELVKAVGFVAKWGILKPVQGVGVLTGSNAQGQAARGLVTDQVNSDPSRALAPDAQQRLLQQAQKSLFGGLVRPLNQAPQPRPNITVNATLNVKGGIGPLKDDGRDIAKQFTDQITTSLADAMEQFSNEQGGQ